MKNLRQLVFDELKSMAILQTKYYEKSISHVAILKDLNSIKIKFLSLVDKINTDDKLYCNLFMIFLCQRLSESIEIEEKMPALINNELKEFKKYISNIKCKTDFDFYSDTNEKINKNALINREIESSSCKRNKRTNYSKTISKILKNWLRNNLNSPYPSETEKIELSELTGLDQTQINNWFINARRRILPILKNTRFNK